MNLPAIESKHLEWLSSRVGGERLQNNLRASTVGWACDRYHVYSLTKPQPAPSPELQAIFDEGAVHEKDVERKLRELGFEVEGVQQEFRYENPLIAAHIDGKFREPKGDWFPYDAKSIATWAYDEINSAEDLMHSKKAWHRLYPIQIMLYMLVTNSPYGCLIFKNKQTGMVKGIWFSFDEHISWLDDAIKRAERVYAAKAAGQLGDTTTDLELCQQCPWKAECLPDRIASGGVSFLESPELKDLLLIRDANVSAHKEYESADGRIKKMLKELPLGEKVCGDFLIQVKEQKRGAYSVEAQTIKTIKIAKMAGGAEVS